jgi:hypothetical protein
MTGKKKKTKKKGLGCLPRLVILLFVLIIGVYVAARVFFPAERVRAEIVKRASETLGRNVELDNVAFSLLPTPSLDMRGIRIYNPENFPGAEFVVIDQLTCGLKIMPLLRKQLVFSQISVRHPVIKLHKTAEGRTNYSFELDTGGEPIETPAGPKESVTSEEAALTVFAFDWAEIKNGDIVYIDDSSQSKTVLSNFSLETRLHVDEGGNTGRSVGTISIPSVSSSFLPENIPLAVDMAYNAQIDFQHADLIFEKTTLAINGIPFEIEATIRNLADPSSIFASIKARDVSLEPLMDYLPASEGFDKGLLRLQGKLNGEVEARIEFEEQRDPYLSGKFTVKDLTLGYQTVSTRAHFDALNLEFDMDSASFASEGGKLSDRDFSLSGKVSNWDDLKYNLKTKGSYALIGLVPFLDTTYSHELSGTANFDLDVRGQKSKWLDTRFLGSVSVEEGYYTNDSLISPLERFDMIISFEEKRVSINSFYVEYPGVRASLNGTVRNGFAHLIEPREGHKKPYLDFVLRAPVVNYDILVPEEEGEAAVAAGEGTAELSAPIFLPDIEAGGKVSIDTLVYSKVELTNITGDVAYKDGVITFKNTEGNIYTGTFSGEGSVDINDMYQPAVACNFAARDVEANDFMARFANLDGHLYGKINLDGNLTGNGAEFTDFVKTLSADGNVMMGQGKLVNFQLINQLAEKFNFKTFEEEEIRDLVSAVKIRNGKLLLDGTKVISKMGDWDIGGTVGFLEKAQDLDMNVYLSPDFVKQLNLPSFLLDDKGRYKVGFKLGGTYDNPTISNFSLDNSALQENLEDGIKKEAGKLIKDLFKKP